MNFLKDFKQLFYLLANKGVISIKFKPYNYLYWKNPTIKSIIEIEFSPSKNIFKINHNLVLINFNYITII